MISDVLSDAIHELDGYLAEEMYVADPILHGWIVSVRGEMETLLRVLDDPRAAQQERPTPGRLALEGEAR